MAPLETEGEKGADYLNAWQTIGRAMEDGTSWSGHERNRAWINLGPDGFVDVSAVAGLDRVEDGRVALRTDWDRDGDVDLWLRFRNGPTLRYLENQSNPDRTLSLDVAVGDSTSRLDLGWLDASGERHRRALAPRGADGYLARGPARIHAPIPDGVSAVRLTVRPRGEGTPEAFDLSLAEGFRWELRGGKPVPSPALPDRANDRQDGELADATLPTRVILRTPLPISPGRLAALGAVPRPDGESGATLVVIKDPDCETCEAVLPAALASIQDVAGLSPRVHSMGNPGDDGNVSFLHALAASILGPGAELALPLSALVDSQGQVHALYTGSLSAEQVVKDLGWFVLEPVQAAFRSSTGVPGRAGRWFHGAPRSFAALTEELGRVGLETDAAFYSERGR